MGHIKPVGDKIIVNVEGGLRITYTIVSICGNNLEAVISDGYESMQVKVAKK